MAATFPSLRLRRLRAHPVLRDLVREVSLHREDLILPLFIKGETGPRVPIASMPGVDQIPLSGLQDEIQEISRKGLFSVILFGIPPFKDACGSSSYCEEGIIQQAIQRIHQIHPSMLVISDLCFCEYTDHGHCGVWDLRLNQLNNDATLDLLVAQAISHAKAGVDVIAPSGMMDGMVTAVRSGLDQAGFSHVPILSYSVKYHSCLYGPFRAAAEGAPTFGDRSSHQMDPSNALEALREVALDVQEGADLLMVKPAHAYLDVICRIKQAHPHIPLGAYHTSGEFALIKAAAEKGWIDERQTVLEILRSIRRAGADFIISYYAKQAAEWL